MKGKTPKVTGIGGIFFKSNAPKEMGEWYQQNLGIDVGEYGAVFESRNVDNPDEVTSLNWSTFKSDTTYFEPSKKDFMINYRVQNIEGLRAQFVKDGITVLDEIEEFEYGKFLHILDLEGNKIELWEPNAYDFKKEK